MYQRILQDQLQKNFFSGNIIMLLGARQIGKTTLATELLKSYDISEIASFNGDDAEDNEALSKNSLRNLNLHVAESKIILIDEAQKIPNIWESLKLLIDHYKDQKQIIITWSSSINLLEQTSESLTGRKIVYWLFPISVWEIKLTYNTREVVGKLEELLIFGSYPAVLNATTLQAKMERLRELSSASLYRDILEFQQVKNSQSILKLLKLIALQLGKEISMNELASNLSIDKNTVERYIDLLEKSFIIFRLPPYFTNKRKELNKANKIYFYDLGIRNALIGNYDALDGRNDVGELRENFLIIERMKKQSYSSYYGHNYFWRTYNQAEVDWIEAQEVYLNTMNAHGGKVSQADIDDIIAKIQKDVDYQKQFIENQDPIKNIPLDPFVFRKTSSERKCESCTFREVCSKLG